MKTVYKLTNSEMRTHRGFQWELGKWYETTREGKLCSPGWLYFYSDPLVGLFLNSAHADIGNPRLFRAEVERKFLNNHGLKCGYTKVRLVEELPVPQISFVQRVRFAILCAKKVYKGKEWNKWANNWLSRKDRTEKSIVIAKSAVIAVESAVQSTAKSALCAIQSATSIASAFCMDKSVKSAAKSAFCAIQSATRIASAFCTDKSAKNAAKSAFFATKSKKIDLIKIARKAMKE